MNIHCHCGRCLFFAFFIPRQIQEHDYNLPEVFNVWMHNLLDITLHQVIPLRFASVNATQTSLLTPRDLEENPGRCTICIIFFDLQHEVRRLPCGHIFHTGCVMEWLRQHDRCPNCNTELGRPITETESRLMLELVVHHAIQHHGVPRLHPSLRYQPNNLMIELRTIITRMCEQQRRMHERHNHEQRRADLDNFRRNGLLEEHRNMIAPYRGFLPAVRPPRPVYVPNAVLRPYHDNYVFRYVYRPPAPNPERPFALWGQQMLSEANRNVERSAQNVFGEEVAGPSRQISNPRSVNVLNVIEEQQDDEEDENAANVATEHQPQPAVAASMLNVIAEEDEEDGAAEVNISVEVAQPDATSSMLNVIVEEDEEDEEDIVSEVNISIEVAQPAAVASTLNVIAEEDEGVEEDIAAEANISVTVRQPVAATSMLNVITEEDEEDEEDIAVEENISVAVRQPVASTSTLNIIAEEDEEDIAAEENISVAVRQPVASTSTLNIIAEEDEEDIAVEENISVAVSQTAAATSMLNIIAEEDEDDSPPLFTPPFLPNETSASPIESYNPDLPVDDNFHFDIFDAELPSSSSDDTSGTSSTTSTNTTNPAEQMLKQAQRSRTQNIIARRRTIGHLDNRETQSVPLPRSQSFPPTVKPKSKEESVDDAKKRQNSTEAVPFIITIRRRRRRSSTSDEEQGPSTSHRSQQRLSAAKRSAKSAAKNSNAADSTASTSAAAMQDYQTRQSSLIPVFERRRSSDDDSCPQPSTSRRCQQYMRSAKRARTSTVVSEDCPQPSTSRRCLQYVRSAKRAKTSIPSSTVVSQDSQVRKSSLFSTTTKRGRKRNTSEPSTTQRSQSNSPPAKRLRTPENSSSNDATDYDMSELSSLSAYRNTPVEETTNSNRSDETSTLDNKVAVASSTANINQPESSQFLSKLNIRTIISDTTHDDDRPGPSTLRPFQPYSMPTQGLGSRTMHTFEISEAITPQVVAAENNLPNAALDADTRLTVLSSWSSSRNNSQDKTSDETNSSTSMPPLTTSDSNTAENNNGTAVELHVPQSSQSTAISFAINTDNANNHPGPSISCPFTPFSIATSTLQPQASNIFQRASTSSRAFFLERSEESLNLADAALDIESRMSEISSLSTNRESPLEGYREAAISTSSSASLPPLHEQSHRTNSFAIDADASQPSQSSLSSTTRRRINALDENWQEPSTSQRHQQPSRPMVEAVNVSASTHSTIAPVIEWMAPKGTLLDAIMYPDNSDSSDLSTLSPYTNSPLMIDTDASSESLPVPNASENLNVNQAEDNQSALNQQNIASDDNVAAADAAVCATHSNQSSLNSETSEENEENVPAPTT